MLVALGGPPAPIPEFSRLSEAKHPTINPRAWDSSTTPKRPARRRCKIRVERAARPCTLFGGPPQKNGGSDAIRFENGALLTMCNPAGICRTPRASRPFHPEFSRLSRSETSHDESIGVGLCRPASVSPTHQPPLFPSSSSTHGILLRFIGGLQKFARRAQQDPGGAGGSPALFGGPAERTEACQPL